jgi:hypothetical protein
MVAFFMPGMVYLADAVGTQTEMIIVRGLSLGVPIGRMVGRELAAVVAIGLALATVTAPLVWWLWQIQALPCRSVYQSLWRRPPRQPWEFCSPGYSISCGLIRQSGVAPSPPSSRICFQSGSI